MFGHLNEMKIDVSDMTEVVGTFRKAVKDFGLLVERFDSAVAALIEHNGGKHHDTSDTESGVATERNKPAASGEVHAERHLTSDGESGTVFSFKGTGPAVHERSDDSVS
jgi:hypothetical protein